jgi:hypothetical protein
MNIKTHLEMHVKVLETICAVPNGRSAEYVLETFSVSLQSTVVETFLICLKKCGDLLGTFLGTSLITKKLPANWKKGDQLNLVATMSPHKSGIFCPFP